MTHHRLPVHSPGVFATRDSPCPNIRSFVLLSATEFERDGEARILVVHLVSHRGPEATIGFNSVDKDRDAYVIASSG
ncbi:hypothetical protein IFM47457_05129 [Aspergillus lentulus]|nr:hypothetical protein IFM47457_05129 [Aspergillus lentulus]